jgi:signal transduction histidine kinase
MRALITAITTSSPQLVAFGERYEAAIESVSTIISCCAHQRRIVDDILTLSKLDSKLLQIAPSLTNLDSMLSELKKMFEADAQKFDVALQLDKDLGNVKWAMLDTGRLMQVLTNLITKKQNDS